jgi:hypothetical protein
MQLYYYKVAPLKYITTKMIGIYNGEIGHIRS